MNKDIMSKALILSIIFLFVGIGFTSVTAIKSDVSESKAKPIVNPSGIDVYTDCEISTPEGNPNGRALLFPGFFYSWIEPGVQGTSEASGILVKTRLDGDDYPVTIDGNIYYNADWDFMIVSNYGGLIDNYIKVVDGANKFRLDGNASRVIVINF